MFKCIQCCGERKHFEAKREMGLVLEGATAPEIRDAVTLAPIWQEKMIGPQMVLACITVPVCMEHLAVNEISKVDQAIREGRIALGGMG